jgi:hypothetical protein
MYISCQYHKGKNVVVSDVPRVRIVNPRNPKTGMWKANLRRMVWPEWKYTSSFLMKKYVRKQHESVFGRLGEHKRERSLVYNQCMRMKDEYQGVKNYKATGYNHGSQKCLGGCWDWRPVWHHEITSTCEVAEASRGNQAAADSGMPVDR